MSSYVPSSNSMDHNVPSIANGLRSTSNSATNGSLESLHEDLISSLPPPPTSSSSGFIPSSPMKNDQRRLEGDKLTTISNVPSDENQPSTSVNQLQTNLTANAPLRKSSMIPQTAINSNVNQEKPPSVPSNYLLHKMNNKNNNNNNPVSVTQQQQFQQQASSNAPALRPPPITNGNSGFRPPFFANSPSPPLPSNASATTAHPHPSGLTTSPIPHTNSAYPQFPPQGQPRPPIYGQPNMRAPMMPGQHPGMIYNNNPMGSINPSGAPGIPIMMRPAAMTSAGPRPSNGLPTFSMVPVRSQMKLNVINADENPSDDDDDDQVKKYKNNDNSNDSRKASSFFNTKNNHTDITNRSSKFIMSSSSSIKEFSENPSSTNSLNGPQQTSPRIPMLPGHPPAVRYMDPRYQQLQQHASLQRSGTPIPFIPGIIRHPSMQRISVAPSPQSFPPGAIPVYAQRPPIHPHQAMMNAPPPLQNHTQFHQQQQPFGHIMISRPSAHPMVTAALPSASQPPLGPHMMMNNVGNTINVSGFAVRPIPPSNPSRGQKRTSSTISLDQATSSLDNTIGSGTTADDNNNTINSSRRPSEISEQLITGNLLSTSSSTTALEGFSIEFYRENAKKSTDPTFQFDFANYLIRTANNLKVSSQNDSKSVKRAQELLYTEALKWIKKLASQGKSALSDAQFFLAECYGNASLGLSIDHEKAFNLYVQASKQSHPSSTYRTAVCYEVGAGTKRDASRAAQFFRKAAALGDTAAMYKLGMILLNGQLNQSKNPREAITWLKRAASQADENMPHALHELGILYEGKVDAGGSILPDPAYAYDLFYKAAHFGYAPSQYKLGLCYEYGLLNLPIDPRRSIAWYSKAAEQGDPEAELALSGWYLTGADNVLIQSDQEAYLWARKAADKGLAKAEYAVGYYIENKIGGNHEQSDECKKWYMRAAAQGNKRAIQRLDELKVYGGDSKCSGGGKRRDFRQEKDAKNGECVLM